MPAREETEPSALAQTISAAIDSTTNHAELIDRIIAEHATLCCSYCNTTTFSGGALRDGKWSDEARKAMTDHILTCSSRPEQKLLEKIEELEARTFPSESDKTGLALLRELVGGNNALRDMDVFKCDGGEHDERCECFWDQCEAWAEADESGLTTT